MRAIAGALLCLGCIAAEPEACRDPQNVSFVEESRVGACDAVRDLDLCTQMRGIFDRETCEVSASYACPGEVSASVFYTFRANEAAHGFEVYRGAACRVERTMIERH